MSPTIAIVALPIGNVDDLSKRARVHLSEADLLFCEDSRKIAELSRRANLSITAKIIAIPGDRERTFDWNHANLASYKNWVLVSDAGTPLLNDPGKSLVEWAHKSLHPIIAIPGSCAPIAALQWSGGFGLPLSFAGFPPKSSASALEDFFSIITTCKTFSFFCSRHQFEKIFEWFVSKKWTERPCHIAREMTKKHEELFRGTIGEAQEWFLEKQRKKLPIGEMTILLEGDAHKHSSSTTMSLNQLSQIRSSSPKTAAKILSSLTGESTKTCYNEIVRKSNDSNPQN